MDIEEYVKQQNGFLNEILGQLEQGKTILERLKTKDKRLENINTYIETLENLGNITNDDYTTGKINKYLDTINSIKDFYQVNCINVKMKEAIKTPILLFNMNFDSILAQERGLWDGRQEVTISPRVPTQTGKGKWKKTKTNKKRLRKKRTTKRNGRRKKN
jgi:hypothetical protein